MNKQQVVDEIHKEGRGREFGDQGWRRIEFGDHSGRIREFGDHGAENERVETWRAEQECRVQKGIMELHRTLDSAGIFGPGEKVPHGSTQAYPMHHGNQRDGSIR